MRICSCHAAGDGNSVSVKVHAGELMPRARGVKHPSGRDGGLGGRLLFQQAAKVVEVFLIGGRFFAVVPRPFLFEFGGGHGVAVNSASLSPLGMGRKYPTWRTLAAKMSAVVPGPRFRAKRVHTRLTRIQPQRNRRNRLDRVPVWLRILKPSHARAEQRLDKHLPD